MLSWVPSIFALSASTITLLSGDVVAASNLSQEHTPSSRIYGGEITKTCEFPQTVQTGGCTGTLVHPRVMISAAHCGSLRSATFGEHSRSAVAKKVSTKWCEKSSSGGRDSQICVLSEPMEGVPVVPIIQGCEMDEIKKGAKVLLAGFGYDENDPAGGSPGGEKRWVETDIRVVKSNLDIHIGGDGKGGCNGDSGGPAFLQMKDGTWRTIGATHAGATSPGSHPNCDTGIWKSTGKLMGWYEEMLAKHNETDIDLSPCFDDQGKWAPNEHCGGYVKDLKGPFGTWADGCGKGAPVVKYSATCGEPFAPNDDEGESGGGDGGGDGDGGDQSPDNAAMSFKSPTPKSKIQEDEDIKVEVQLKDVDNVEDVLLQVDGKDVEADDKAPYAWTLDPLSAGKHKLKAIARDEDEKEVASTKTLTITVLEEGDGSGGEPSEAPEPSDEDSAGEDSEGGSPGDESEGSSPDPDKDDPKDSSDPKGDGDKKRGCAVQSQTGSPGFLGLILGLVGWAGLRRRRSRS